MLRLSEKEIIKLISEGAFFECEHIDGSFTLKIEAYTPAICTAVHDGHNFGRQLINYCALSEAERLYEEDPHTGELIKSMPITMIGNDSRYEYDLNRPLARCIYNKAWGKEVWSKKLPASLRKRGIEKHKVFYRILDALIAKVEERFGACIVFDIHSYNHKRIQRSTPTFNLGTEQIDDDRWGRVIKRFRNALSKLEFSQISSEAALDDVFYGRGYLISHVNSRFEDTLVIPCEVKKVFMDELTGEPYPLVLDELKAGFKHALTDTGAYFARSYSKKPRLRRLDMLSSKLDPAIIKVDRELARLAKGMETLNYINPVNIAQEKRKFLTKKGNYQPAFKYKPLVINPYEFREKLYRLPVNTISDVGIQQMYCQVIDGLSSKIDLLVNAGSPQFVYSSLNYYGEPSLEDEANAQFLLHAAKYDPDTDKRINASDAVEYFRLKAADWGMKCKVELSSKIVASAMVSGARRTLYVNKDASLTETEVNALAHHELGVHMATTLNAALQPLRVFTLGLPGNTMTQEGLAILNEFHSGNMCLTRLQGLAHRVIAVKEMLKYGDFRHTYSYLHEEMRMPTDEAFKLSVRVHRSGGFTKDYLYLRGVSEALRLYKDCDISNLYVGKTGFAYRGIINELIERELISKPRFVPEALNKPEFVPDILNYLVSSIKPTTPVGLIENVCSDLKGTA
ncbi:flavohemoglobin expression-modulating QEGLA motif protein [uncultured Neptuniibacter sp.]|uniref:flavohemoglobin expression-modulating QEGLA motif protein n=1 Tax=uncultured Neptuniibacter sp. TaxID=502143 RepID=UPI002624917D|nr:flavohemoglobin expression-modulating QEGLA motif protein [uncultured Neptuniibacter sp.]